MSTAPPTAAADLMISQAMLDDLRGETWASAALVDLFVMHGRRPFRPRLEDLAAATMWRGRGARQRFARAIAVLHAKGHIRWLPDGRYKIVTRDLLTVAEYRVAP
jgi:hypothetical protein